MKYILLMFLLVGTIFVGGCLNNKVTFSEVLQPKKGELYYTKYNIWYVNPDNIDCRNIHEGTFLPIGSQIVPVKIDGDMIVFKDDKGNVYKIKFNSAYRLTTIADYIHQTFSKTTPQEMFEGINPRILERIKRGEVVPGMSRKDVILTYGPPPPIRTASMKNDTWIYWIGQTQYVRIIFRGDIVRNIVNF